MGHRVFATVVFAAFTLALVPHTPAFAKSPLVPPTLRDELTNDEQAKCPPQRDKKPIAPIPEDRKNKDGTSTDYYIVKYHWDDKAGSDLTVIVWCVKGTHFSLEVTQSKNGAASTSVPAGLEGGTTDSGPC